MVAANDQAAIGFVRGLRELGVDVPGDVSVVGYDDIAPSGFVEPPLTTVHVPLYDLGVRGMRRALQLLDGGTRCTPIELPLELTVRASTGTTGRFTGWATRMYKRPMFAASAYRRGRRG